MTRGVSLPFSSRVVGLVASRGVKCRAVAGVRYVVESI